MKLMIRKSCLSLLLSTACICSWRTGTLCLKGRPCTARSSGAWDTAGTPADRIPSLCHSSACLSSESRSLVFRRLACRRLACRRPACRRPVCRKLAYRSLAFHNPCLCLGPCCTPGCRTCRLFSSFWARSSPSSRSLYPCTVLHHNQVVCSLIAGSAGCSTCMMKESAVRAEHRVQLLLRSEALSAGKASGSLDTSSAAVDMVLALNACIGAVLFLLVDSFSGIRHRRRHRRLLHFYNCPDTDFCSSFLFHYPSACCCNCSLFCCCCSSVVLERCSP
mmetsp:Transcript_25198/g.29043  ORF Transcript_25198/g.29043 Transcript_25198/m.29043 type:complete len:277 (-) Transcript_25198:1013-1843(-)